jgi:hypothetical protein
MSNVDTNPQTKSCMTYRYRIEQTLRGALITVSGDAIDEVVADYTRLRVKLAYTHSRVGMHNSISRLYPYTPYVYRD